MSAVVFAAGFGPLRDKAGDLTVQGYMFIGLGALAVIVGILMVLGVGRYARDDEADSPRSRGLLVIAAGFVAVLLALTW